MAATTSMVLGSMAVANGYMGAQSARAEAEYQRSMYSMNSRFAEQQADDAIKRGAEAEGILKRQTKQAIGTQRVALAAQGVDVDSGSAIDVQTDAAIMGELDAMRLRNNAYQEAFGFRVQAQDYRTRSELAASAGRYAARNSLLTGGMNAGSLMMNDKSSLTMNFSSKEQGPGARSSTGQSYKNYGNYA